MNFVCPKDFKNGRLIFGKYTILDLFLLIGINLFCIAMIIFLIIQEKILWFLIFFFLFIMGITITLSFPYQNFHNILSFIKMFIIYLKKDKKFFYGGVRYFEFKQK